MKKMHYWLAFVAPWPLCNLAPTVDRMMARRERKEREAR